MPGHIYVRFPSNRSSVRIKLTHRYRNMSLSY